jgi:hypothetical protein
MSGIFPPPPNLAAIIAALMSKKYIHIAYYCPPPMTELEALHLIQPIINTADDWLRYTNTNWIVWSSWTPKQWYDKFAAVPQLNQCSILIVKLDLSPENRAGQLPQWVWDWIQRPRT